MILIYGKVSGSFEICPGKVGNFLSSCREVKSAHSGSTVINFRDQFSKVYKTRNSHTFSSYEKVFIGFTWKITSGIFIKSSRFETSRVRKKDFSKYLYVGLSGFCGYDNSRYTCNYRIKLRFSTSLDGPKRTDEFGNQTLLTNGSGFIHKKRSYKNQKYKNKKFIEFIN